MSCLICNSLIPHSNCNLPSPISDDDIETQTLHHLRSRIQILQLEYTQVANRRNQKQPISSLPSDVLTQIFTYYANSHISASHFLALNTLRSVCYNWRQVVELTPSFWRLFPAKQLSSYREITHVLTRYVDALPEGLVDIYIGGHDADMERSHRLYEIERQILTHIVNKPGLLERIRVLHIFFYTYEAWHLLSHPTTLCRLTSIVKLTLLTYPQMIPSLSTHTGSHPFPPSLLQARLRSLPPVFLMSFGNLTSLDISYVNYPEQLLDLLRHCRETLTKLTLDLPSWQTLPEEYAFPNVITFPNVVGFECKSGLRVLMGVLRFPRLICFSFLFEHPDYSTMDAFFSSFRLTLLSIHCSLSAVYNGQLNDLILRYENLCELHFELVSPSSDGGEILVGPAVAEIFESLSSFSSLQLLDINWTNYLGDLPEMHMLSSAWLALRFALLDHPSLFQARIYCQTEVADFTFTPLEQLLSVHRPGLAITFATGPIALPFDTTDLEQFNY